jgi:membrane protease YdiL (CAAX protease family)
MGTDLLVPRDGPRSGARVTAGLLALATLITAFRLAVVLGHSGPGGAAAGYQLGLWLLAGATAAAAASVVVAVRAARGQARLVRCLPPFAVSLAASAVGNAYLNVDTRAGFIVVASLGLAACIALGAATWSGGGLRPASVPRWALGLVPCAVAAVYLFVRLDRHLAHQLMWSDRIWIDSVFGILDEVAFLTVAALLALSTIGLKPADLGLRRPFVAARTAVAWTVGVYVAQYLAIVIYELAGAHVRVAFAFPQHGHQAALSAFAVFAIVIGPAAEEILFRGVLYRLLRERGGIVLALVVQAAAFAFMHWFAGAPLANVPIYGLGGVGLGLLYERTGSLLPGIAMHAFINASAFELALHRAAIVADVVGLSILVVVIAAAAARSRAVTPQPASA